MKKILFAPILVVALTLSLISCKKESPSANNDNNSDQIDRAMTAKAATFFAGCTPWRIDLFINNGADETSHYNGFTFTYCPDNTVYASNDIFSFQGNWWIYLAAGGPTSYFELDFKLNDQTARFQELEGMWKLSGMDANKITLDSQDGKTRLVFVRMPK